MSSKHTPGPWKQKVQSSSLWPVCTVYGTKQGWVEIYAPNASDTKDASAESSANARLIAAAPDLLEALIDLAGAGAEAWGDDRPCVRIARAAIAKATGETHE